MGKSTSLRGKGVLNCGHIPADCKVEGLCKSGCAAAMLPLAKLLWTLVGTVMLLDIWQWHAGIVYRTC